MGILDAVRNKLAPLRRSYYTLWTLPIEQARDQFRKDPDVDRVVRVDTEDGPQSYVIRELTEEDLPLFDKVRPEAPGIPRGDLDEGQLWLGAIDEKGGLAAYTFLVLNEGDKSSLAKRYFRVQPGEAYLHAAWTHPDHRRRGLHTFLTEARIRRAAQSPSISKIVTHVAVGLFSSEQAFRAMDFRPTHRLTVARRGSGGTVYNRRVPIENAPHEESSGDLRVMVLAGESPRAVAAIAEVAQQFPAKVIVASSSYESPGAKSQHVWQTVLLPDSSKPEYVDGLRQAVLALEPDVVVPLDSETTRAATTLKEEGSTTAAFVSPDSSQQLRAFKDAADQDIVEGELVSPGEKSSESEHVTHGGYFAQGEPLAEFQFAFPSQAQNVIESQKNERVAESARAALAKLGWTGFAAMTYLDSGAGQVALHNADAGLWDSYDLATRSGALVVTAGIEDALGIARAPEASLGYQEVAEVLADPEGSGAEAQTFSSKLSNLLKDIFEGVAWDLRALRD